MGGVQAGPQGCQARHAVIIVSLYCNLTRVANDPLVVTITEKAPSRVIVKTDGSFALIMKKTYLAVTSTLQNTRRVVVHL